MNCNGCSNGTGDTPTWMPQGPGSSYSGPGALAQMSDNGGRVYSSRYTMHHQAMKVRRRGAMISCVALVAVLLVALYLWRR